MLCIVALVVLAVLSIFSARYRAPTKEAFKCVFRMMTLRPCTTGFNQKVKMHIVSATMKRSEKLANFVYKYFKPISWLFTIIFFVSIIITAQTVYNLAAYGMCEPSSEFCIFNPTHTTCSNETHCLDNCTCADNCSLENNFSACLGNCTCDKTICDS
ncbi:MAG: hypothetical protein ABIG30_00975 [Candidatus Aenigmatarchaeota archaeon]